MNYKVVNELSGILLQSVFNSLWHCITICLSLWGSQLQSVFDSVMGTTICLSLGGSELQSVFASVAGTTICLSLHDT